MNWMQKMQNKKETKETKSFFKGETNMQKTKAWRDRRELHLEMVSDKVTYVRVY